MTEDIDHFYSCEIIMALRRSMMGKVVHFADSFF